jgi:hypothetical protein
MWTLIIGYLRPLLVSTLMWFFRYHINVNPNVDVDSYLLASTLVDGNIEMSLLFINSREAKFPARLLVTTH